MRVHDIICFESRLTVISFNILGTKIYGTLAVSSEFKSGMEDISSDVAKEFAEPFKKEVFINSFFRSSNHSFMHAFIHSSFLSFFLCTFFLLLVLQPYIFKSTIHSYIVLYLLTSCIAFVKLNFRK